MMSVLYYAHNLVSMYPSNKLFRTIFWIVPGIVIGLASQISVQAQATLQEANASPTPSPGTVDAIFERSQEVGSTDGIVFMVVIIVLIVVIPIMLRRKAWTGRSRKKRGPGK